MALVRRERFAYLLGTSGISGAPGARIQADCTRLSGLALMRARETHASPRGWTSVIVAGV